MPLVKEHRLALAESEVERTRDRLVDTVSDFAEMLEPKRIISDVWENAKDKGADLAENAVDAVKKRPLVFGGIVAALTAFLAREPIKDAAASAYGAMTSSKKKSGRKAKTVAAAEASPTPSATPKLPTRPKAGTAPKAAPRARKKPPAKTVEK